MAKNKNKNNKNLNADTEFAEEVTKKENKQKQK